MKILFLNASPREEGYTPRVIRLIAECIGPGHDLRWVKVNSLTIRPCQSCMKCRPDGECVLPSDDAHDVAKLIREADALVMGSPTYFGNITGPLKTLIDRCLTAFEIIAPSGLEAPTPIHSGQKAAIVAACNMPPPMSRLPTQGAGTLAAMKIVTDAGGYDLVGSILVDGAATLTELPVQTIEKAMEIAEALVNGSH